MSEMEKRSLLSKSCTKVKLSAGSQSVLSQELVKRRVLTLHMKMLVAAIEALDAVGEAC